MVCSLPPENLSPAGRYAGDLVSVTIVRKARLHPGLCRRDFDICVHSQRDQIITVSTIFALHEPTNTVQTKGCRRLSTEAEIIAIIQEILKHQAFPETEVTADSPLYDEGVGLDSLCVAELSAILEKRYGKDPYTSGVMPQSVGDIISFYGDG